MGFNKLNMKHYDEILSLLDNVDVDCIFIYSTALTSMVIRTSREQMKRGAILGWHLCTDTRVPAPETDWGWKTKRNRTLERQSKKDGFPRIFSNHEVFMYELMSYLEIRQEIIKKIVVPAGASPYFDPYLHDQLCSWQPVDAVRC